MQNLEDIQREGYTVREARLIQLVQRHADADPEFGKRYRNGAYSLADIVRILAPLVDVRIRSGREPEMPPTDEDREAQAAYDDQWIDMRRGG